MIETSLFCLGLQMFDMQKAEVPGPRIKFPEQVKPGQKIRVKVYCRPQHHLGFRHLYKTDKNHPPACIWVILPREVTLHFLLATHPHQKVVERAKDKVQSFLSRVPWLVCMMPYRLQSYLQCKGVKQVKQGWGTCFLWRAFLIVIIRSPAADSEGAARFFHGEQCKKP